jgi:CheY-like chemotaxis protein
MNGSRKILLIEDDPDDREMLVDAIKWVSPQAETLLVENGLEAINYLSGLQKTDPTLPLLIVLDLNMPFLDGRQTFDKIRNELKLEEVKVIVLTSSESPYDRAFFEDRGVEFFTKPNNMQSLHQIASHVVNCCQGE